MVSNPSIILLLSLLVCFLAFLMKILLLFAVAARQACVHAYIHVCLCPVSSYSVSRENSKVSNDLVKENTDE